MCGIAGILHLDGRPVSAETVTAMVRAIAHRGPDDSGVWTEGAIGLGHARLSIIDLSPTGHQPMTTPDGRATIVFNGEVYNFPALRERLVAEGVAFRGTSDTEVVLHAYARWGAASFAMLQGMFALAVWDSPARRLHLVRDRFGIKPLYYAANERRIAFASEIKGVLASGGVDRGIDWAALHEYLYFGNPLRDRTMFRSVREVLPGHFLTIGDGGITDSTYWRVEETPVIHDDLDTATRRVREGLEQAVKRHLISDVPVGVFLSGGIDSTALTALASRHYQGRLRTYSCGFDFDRGVNELPKARRVAEAFGTEHHEIHIAGGALPETIEQLVRAHDEPFGDCADIPLYLLCKELRGAVKVILQGDGGDEIFAGYRRYNVLSYDRTWRAMARLAPVFMSVVPRRPTYYRAARFFQAMGHPDPAIRLALFMTMESQDLPPTRMLSSGARSRSEAHDPFASYREAHGRLCDLDPVQRSLYADTMLLLPDQFLEKVDKATMAHGIEVRVPFLDAELSDYALGLPAHLKVRRGQKKFILRRALRGIVSDDILDGPKTGFGVPYAHWLRTTLADYARSAILDGGAGLIDRAAVESAFREHIDGRRNHGFILWKLLNLALWMRFYEPDLN